MNINITNSIVSHTPAVESPLLTTLEISDFDNSR